MGPLRQSHWIKICLTVMRKKCRHIGVSVQSWFWCIRCKKLVVGVVYSGCGGWRCFLNCSEKEEFLMGVVQYCGPTLVTGQLDWRCATLKIHIREAIARKKWNFMKKFHKTVTPFMKSLFRTLNVYPNIYTVLNKRYEIRLTPPPVCEIFS